jgi:hypothetical protein
MSSAALAAMRRLCARLFASPTGLKSVERSTKLFAISAVLTLSVSCVSDQTITLDGCNWIEKIRLINPAVIGSETDPGPGHVGDRIFPATAKQIVAHNRSLAAFCDD